MVLWVIAFLLFLILLRLWPGLRSVVTKLVGAAVILALVLASLGGVAAGLYYMVKEMVTVPGFAWKVSLAIAVVVASVASAAARRREERDKKRIANKNPGGV